MLTAVLFIIPKTRKNQNAHQIWMNKVKVNQDNGIYR